MAEQRERLLRYHENCLKITWISVVTNILLAVIKCILGVVANSKALIGDGLHSLMDLGSDIAVVFGLKMSAKPEDENHLYGHHKFVSLSALFISIILLVLCVCLIYVSVSALFMESRELPEWPALIAAFLSFLLKEGLYFWTKAVARRFKSRLLMANAWHHRTDSFSSVLVFIAIGAAMYGGPSWAFIDSIGGLFLGFYLIFQGVRLFRHACNDLLDTAPGKDILNDLREHILTTPGTVAYHDFRARPVGDLFEVDLHLQVAPNLTIEEGHLIADKVKKNILENHTEVIDVLIHIEPAKDGYLKEHGIWGHV